MGSSKKNEKSSVNQLRSILSEVLGEELCTGLCDIITAERPRIDMYDGGDTLTVLVEAPGIISPGDVFISSSSDKLNIKCTTRDKFEENKPGKKLKGECIYETLDRTIDLPYAVDDKAIKAAYENGILEIRMQKVPEGQDSIKVEFKN